MKFIQKFGFIAIFILIAGILPFIWLDPGTIVGGGDVGIPTYLPQRTLQILSNSWWETQGTGTINPTTYTAVPLYFIFSLLDKLGMGLDLIQKLFIFVILAGGSISIYLLAKDFISSKRTAFIAGLFYIFNFTSLSVWHRGVHNAMLMLFLMPLSLLIISRGLSGKKFLSIIWVNLASFLMSYVYGALAYVAVVWILWFSFLLINLIYHFKNKAQRNFIFKYIILLFFSWVALNMWWLYHFVEASKYILGQFTATEFKSRSSDVLVALQVFTKPEYVLRGINSSYHFNNLDWGKFYLSPWVIFLSWIPTLIIFSTTLIKDNYKKSYWIFLIFLTSIVIFISKGINAPLGTLNRLAYDYIGLLAPLRNPYEKIGIILIIPYSILFALGCLQIVTLTKFINRNLLKFFVMIIILLSISLVWPMWRGEIFRSNSGKYLFTVPAYYSEASNWLQSKYDDTRILHLPISPGESVDYNWGYTGIEPSQLFFYGSSIGYEIGVASVDDRVRDLLLSVHNHDTVNIQKAFASLNIGWVVIHNETLYRSRILEPPERINKWLASGSYFLEHTVDFGPLSIWRVKDQYRLGHIYSANKLINLNKIKPQASLNIWDEMNSINDSFFTEERESDQNLLNKYINKRVVFPIKNFVYSPLDTINEEVGLKDLAIVNYLPDTFVYPLILLKENILMFLSQNDPVINCFALSGKRLKEAALLSRQNKFSETNKSLIAYEKQLAKCSEINNDTVIAYTKGNGRDLTLGQLVRQKAVLETEFSDDRVAKEGNIARTKLVDYLTNLGLMSKFDPVKLENNKQLVIFHYSVSEEGNYNIKLNKPDQDLMKNPPTITQIDDHSVNLSPNPAYAFSKEFHEIQLQIESSRNLIEGQVEIKKSNPDPGFTVEIDPATQKPIFIGDAINSSIALTFDLSNLDVEQNYAVSFDIYFTQGTPPFIAILHDSDPLDASGKQIPAVRGELMFNTYPVQWQHIHIPYTPVLNSTSAKVSVILIPWNDCFASFSLLQCEQMGMFNKADRPTNAKFRNIKVEKVFSNDLVLEKVSGEPIQNLGSVNLTWKKIDPTLYEAPLNNQKPPYILVFSETFHPLWQIMDADNKRIDLPHFSINGFANAWLVENPLPEKIRIKFVLQDARNERILISVIAFLLLISITIYLDRGRRKDV